MLGTRLISVEAFLPWLLQFFSSELDLQVAARIAFEYVVHHHSELQSTDFKSSNLRYRTNVFLFLHGATDTHFIHYWTPLIKLLHTNEVKLQPYFHY